MYKVELTKSELIILQDLVSSERRKLDVKNPEFRIVKEMNENFSKLLDY